MEEKRKRPVQRKPMTGLTAGRTRDLWDVGHGLAIQGQVVTRTKGEGGTKKREKRCRYDKV